MLIIFLSLLPCLIWLLFFYIQDWYDREPIWLVGTSFLLGIFSTIPALICNSIGIVLVMAFLGHSNVLSTFVQFFGIVGPVEEGVKLLAVLIFAYKQPEFDEPVDGIIYSAAAALGFAAAENVLYVSQAHSISILVLRGPLANAGHALFSAFWGLALSQAKAAPNIGNQRRNIIIIGWLTAATVHGLYDFILTILGESSGAIIYLPIAILMLGMFGYVEYKTINFIRKSPKNPKNQQLRAMMPCPNCGEMGKASMICQKCRTRLPKMDMGEWRICGYCQTKNDPGAVACKQCRYSLLSHAKTAPSTHLPHFVRLTSKGYEETVYLIDTPLVMIGKTLDNNFVIDEESLDNRHARLVWNPLGYHILQDLNSMNGTFVNGQRIKEIHLQNGYEIRFGQARFIYRA